MIICIDPAAILFIAHPLYWSRYQLRPYAEIGSVPDVLSSFHLFCLPQHSARPKPATKNYQILPKIDGNKKPGW